jgi:hypothetical protein
VKTRRSVTLLLLFTFACKPPAPTPEPVPNDPFDYENPVQLPMGIAEKGHIRLEPPLFLAESLGPVIPEQTQFELGVMLIPRVKANQILQELETYIQLNNYTRASRNFYPIDLNTAHLFALHHTHQITVNAEILQVTSVNMGISNVLSIPFLTGYYLTNYNKVAHRDLQLARLDQYYILFMGSFKHPTNPDAIYYFPLNLATIRDFLFTKQV